MIRKYHFHKLQTNSWYREEEPHNNYETPGRQTKQSNQPPFPTKTTTKPESWIGEGLQSNAHQNTKQPQTPHNGSNNKVKSNKAPIYAKRAQKPQVLNF